MLKQLVIVDPEGLRCDLYETAECLGLFPCIVTHEENRPHLPNDADIIPCESPDTAFLKGVVRQRQVSGVWTPDPEYRGMVHDVAASMRFPHWGTPPDQSFLKVMKEDSIVADLIHPQHFVSTMEAAEEAVREIHIPAYLQSMQSSGYPRRMEVDNIADVPLAFKKITAKQEKPHVSVAKLPQAEVYWVPGYKIGRDFKPIEVIAVEFSHTRFRVPVRYLAPAELSGADYTAVVDVAKQVGLHLPHGVAAITLELIYTDVGPRVMGIRAEYDFEPALKKLLNRGYGLNLDHDVLRLFAGLQPESTPCWEMAAAVQWFQPGSGVVTGVDGVDTALAVKAIREIHLRVKPGDYIGHIEDTRERDRIGYMISQASSTETALDALQIAMGCVGINTKPTLD